MSILFKHHSVMTNEVKNFLQGKNGKVLVDATAGGGGHLEILIEIATDSGKVFAFDRDPRAHKEDAALGVAQRFPHMVKLFCQPFSRIKSTLKSCGVEKVDGLICDLGVSSNQLDDQDRGFSLKSDGPIDMRMDQSSQISAYDWLKTSSEQEIADALFHLGGERKSRSIARMIKKNWPIENSTLALANLVLSAIKPKKWSKIHPATRTFQAIRMAVNDEINELSSLLDDLPDLLAVQGVAVFLSFHSVEDRLIKDAFRKMSKNSSHKDGGLKFEILTKKPLPATSEEIEQNRRARSAKLRAIVRVS